MRATEGDLVLSVKVDHSGTDAAGTQDERPGPSATHPPPSVLCATHQEESAEVRGSTCTAPEAPGPAQQTRTIACQASPRAAKVGPAWRCG